LGSRSGGEIGVVAIVSGILAQFPVPSAFGVATSLTAGGLTRYTLVAPPLTVGLILWRETSPVRGLLLVGIVGLSVALAPVASASPPPPYKNCTQANQDGACNIPSTSEYYQAKLDRDSDGIGCEC
jgi:hypothetical protein